SGLLGSGEACAKSAADATAATNRNVAKRRRSADATRTTQTIHRCVSACAVLRSAIQYMTQALITCRDKILAAWLDQGKSSRDFQPPSLLALHVSRCVQNSSLRMG